MKKLLLTALLFVQAGLAFAAQPEPLPIEACAAQVPYGSPASKKQSVTLICRGVYQTLFDNNAKIPIYSAYVLTPEHATGCFPRSNAWKADASVPSSPRPANYAKSKYDIGHMVNAEDLKWSAEAQKTAPITTNSAPQPPEFNRGVWKKLEDTTRGWALTRNHPILIYVGAIYNRDQNPTIGRDMVTVPPTFYKVLVDTVTLEVMPFIMDAKGSQEDLGTFIVSIAEVQKQTGLVLPLPAGAQFNGLWPIEMKSNRAAKATVCNLR
jgi:endonuclease G